MLWLFAALLLLEVAALYNDVVDLRHFMGRQPLLLITRTISVILLRFQRSLLGQMVIIHGIDRLYFDFAHPAASVAWDLQADFQLAGVLNMRMRVLFHKDDCGSLLCAS